MKFYFIYHISFLNKYYKNIILNRTQKPLLLIIIKNNVKNYKKYKIETVLNSQLHYSVFQYFI